MGAQALWVGSPLSWLESGEVPELCRLQQGSRLSLTASLILSGRDSQGQSHYALYPSLWQSPCKAQVSQVTPFLWALIPTCLGVSLSWTPCYLNLAHCALWIVTSKISCILNLFPGCSLDFLALSHTVEPLGLEVAPWFSLLLPDHSPSLLHNRPPPTPPPLLALNLMSPENTTCYSSLLQLSVDHWEPSSLSLSSTLLLSQCLVISMSIERILLAPLSSLPFPPMILSSSALWHSLLWFYPRPGQYS